MLVWAFIPYVVEAGGALNGYDFDTPQTKSELARAFQGLGLPWIWQPITAQNLQSIVQQVRERSLIEPSLVCNFCDGLDGGSTPGISVIRALEAAGIPFTGAGSAFFALSESKLAMKRIFEAKGIPTPSFDEVPPTGVPHGMCSRLGTPLLVKPDRSAASMGISLRSRVHTDEGIAEQREWLKTSDVYAYADYRSLLVERFVEGPEFTVFVMGDYRQPASIECLPPVERRFNAGMPPEERFLSYYRYWGQYGQETPPPGDGKFYDHAPVLDPLLCARLEDLSRRAYSVLQGTGYARVDFRMDSATRELYVLEVNANCGMSEDDQTSTGCILEFAGMSLASLLQPIIDHGLKRRVA